jgi:hypothetical protein
MDLNDETLRTFIKKKAPKKQREKGNKGARAKVQASKQPQKRRATRRKGNH